MWSLSYYLGRAMREDSRLQTETKKDRIISLSEVSLHDSPSDCWIVLFNQVYNITDFLNTHPGGAEVLTENAGRDATIAFQEAGHTDVSLVVMEPLRIGRLPENEHLNLDLVLGTNWKTPRLSV